MRRLLLAVSLFVSACATALAWSEAGHKITASIAFRQLAPAEQAKIAAILRNHPRFAEDFAGKMPDDIKSGTDAEQNEWIFQQAAIWPDIARGFQGDAGKEFHRPVWHYINIPHFLTDADRAAMQGKVTVSDSLDVPDSESEITNVIQAIRYARKMIADKNTDDAKKAVLLCWVFHDIGDIHQPLHSTALFSQKLFPKGDRGGNSVKTQQRQNLHAVWDQFPGRTAEFRPARNKAIAIVNDPEQSALGKQAARVTDEKVWLDESYMLVVDGVYDNEVLGYLRAHANESVSDLRPLQLTEAYLKVGGGICEKRIVQAGYRLGAVLGQLVQGTVEGPPRRN